MGGKKKEGRRREGRKEEKEAEKGRAKMKHPPTKIERNKGWMSRDDKGGWIHGQLSVHIIMYINVKG